MRSFAIWCKKKDSSSRNDAWKDKVDKNPQIDVHVNIWNQIGNRDSQYCYIDFGIKVYDISLIDEMFLYCPVKLSKDDVKDLGGVYANTPLVNSIFNENYSIVDSGRKRYPVSDKTGIKFVCYALGGHEYEVLPDSVDKDNATIITFSTKSWQNESDKNLGNTYYVRFRIKINLAKEKFIKELNTTDSALNDIFTKTEIIDFRLNDVRSMSVERQELFGNCDKFDIKCVHCLIMRRASDRMLVDGKCDYGVRLLESEIWKDYVDNLSTEVFAYHFKKDVRENIKKNSIDVFNVLVRVQSKKVISKWVYMLIIIVLGIASSLIASLII
ncbi:MAG: hypothetical protein KBS60_02945 [Phascolarctobacterium sp.]|nr:hypothetical protein [Candidatus Phascolarctobacterium caballi]